MKKKALLLIPALLGLFISACNNASEGSINSQDNTSSGPNSGTTSSQNEDSSGSESNSSLDTIQYTITFKDEIGNTLESKKWDEGSIPSYNYEKADTPEWDYTVQGWSLTQGGEVIVIPAASADATYFAIVSQTKRSYLIAFYDENNQEIKSETLEFGAQPSCDYTGPADTQEWDYTFAGWSTSLGGAALTSIPTVSGAANYYAVVSSNKQKYDVKFLDENGDELNTIKYSYGDTPSYTYNKQDTQEWDYTVQGWSLTAGGEVLSNLPVVTGDATYHAIVSAVKQKYTIVFESNGGSSVASITEDYGTSVAKPTDPKRDGYNFVAWSSDSAGNNKVTWPLTLVKNEKFYANWNEKVDIKAYFQTLMEAVGHDPYSYIPDKMKQENSANHVNASDVNYDFTNFTNVNNIKYGGFGEQWHMVIENIEQSELFYSVLTLGETAINASVVLFNNYLDNNPSDTASHTLNETTYTAKLDFHNGVLTYTIQYKTNLTIPFFGTVMPQVDMTYNITTLEKEVRVQLTENNAMKYVVTDDAYVFALEYGVETVSRKAYFQLNRLEDESIQGHIYEFVQYKDKDLVPSCADFYIDETYTSVVGNKARGLVGFKGYINELYKTNEGKLLGYEVRETLTFLTVTGQYNTLWFNLNNITGINSVKAIENENNTGTYTNKNPHDIYLNGSASIFEPTYNKKLTVNTSRKYDVELRKQYFYGYVDNKIVEYETNIPMMFIQADNDKDTNFSDFSKDILSKSGIVASVNLAQTYLNKIQSDYASLIDVFIEHKEDVTSATIENYIGDAIVIA